MLFAVVRVKKPAASLVSVPQPGGGGPGSSTDAGFDGVGFVTGGADGVGVGCGLPAVAEAGTGSSGAPPPSSDDEQPPSAKVAQPAEITALKSPFADPAAAWYTLRLLDEVQMKKLVNEQMILRGGALDEDRAEFAEKVRKVKLVAYSFAAAVIGLLLVFAFYLVVHRETLQRVVQGR